MFCVHTCYTGKLWTKEHAIRTSVIIVFALLILALVVCAIVARRSKRSIAGDVSLLLIALVLPMVGNLIIIASSDWLVSNVGCYVYYIGLDFAVVALLRFTTGYCHIDYLGTSRHRIVLVILAIDVVQLLLNPVTGHAFTTTPTLVEGSTYYSLVPMAGQAVHRVIAYGIFFVSVGIFVYMTVNAAKIYIERYLVILLCMIVCGVWETYYIFSGMPIDCSMISFGVFGLLVYYFAIHYQPMRLLDRMLARVVSSMDSSVFFFDTDGSCIYCNDRARSFIGLDAAGDVPENTAELVKEAIGGWKGSLNEEWSFMRRIRDDAGDRYFDLSVQQVYDDRNRHIGASLTVRDATEEESNLKREKYLATHDVLTGIYNQRHLFEETRRFIDENPDLQYKVVGLDIKDFKIINDIFNKEFGDHVLRVVAEELRTFSKPGTLYGRLTGDKFGLLVPVKANFEEQLEALLEEKPYGERVSNYPIVVHMGVYDVADRDLDVSVMFDRAFMAIKSIKNDLNRHVAVYDDGMRESLIWSQKISSQLEQAIEERQIRPYLQPLVDADGNVEGAEVLVRWIHPEEGFLSPARFIPVFEDNGMIAQLDAFMWERACAILHDWQRRGIDLFLSVNISPKDFYFIDVYGTIRDLVAKYAIDPGKLRLEITETVMMTDIENRLRIIENLRADGFLVEMDDFGSGYSSLNMLKDIPVDVLKIDMMFLYKTKDQDKAKTILQTIINLSDKLGMPSVTEGVETADQLDMLVNMGCRMFQGYYFAKPMPVEEFESLCRVA